MNYSGFRVRKQNKFIMWCLMMVAVLGIGVVGFFVSSAVKDNKGYRTIGVVETQQIASVGTVCFNRCNAICCNSHSPRTISRESSLGPQIVFRA